MDDPKVIARQLSEAQLAKLPKARLFWLRWWSPRQFKPMYFRNANAAFVVIWRLEIGWRMPWLASSAQKLHPELFRTELQRKESEE